MTFRPLWPACGLLAVGVVVFLLFRATPVSEAARPEASSTACGVHSDFLVRSDPLLAPVRPADCSTLTQSPPEFTWPPLEGKFTYTLMLTGPDGKTVSRSTARNWLAWDQVLPPGTYTWRMKSSYDSEVSQPRTFSIAPNAIAFVLPTEEAALRSARSTPRPRTWAGASPIPALRAERAKAFASLVEEVDNKMHLPVQEEPHSGSKDSNYDDTVDEQKRTLNSAFAWAGTKNPKYGADAARRLLAQARWSTTGPIAFRNNDMASRNVAWTLALGYDWTYDYLSSGQKAEILAAIRTRTRDMYEQYIATGEITKNPYDSHGNLTLTITAAIATLMAGDIPEADEWMRGAVDMAVVWTSPWGGADGGFGNGTAQAQWDTGSNLIAWGILRNAAGIDITKKEWVRNYARYIAYMLPPGTPAGLFGDGLEQPLKEVWARVGKAYTAFAPSPLGLWYAGQLSGEDDTRMELMLSPRTLRKRVPLPDGTPNGAVFPSIGWAAMHSDLADQERTSIYFKSSPYGSYNHSHADQNSFVVNDKGKRLVIASGYYDNFRTPHWTDWYKQTRSTNAITFDGGKGQGSDGRQFTGEVTRFETTPGYDYVVGHAEKAYDGALGRAQRTLVYLRPDVLVVYDSLAARAPHTWEWNLHALQRMTPAGPRSVRVANGDAKLCVQVLAGPEVTFTQTDQFTAAPQKSSMNKAEPNQWHGAFVTASKSDNAEFVTLLRIGSDCSKAGDASASRAAGGWQVKVAGKTVEFAGDDVRVR
ncbi:MAG: heparinase II/III domain-containing protein [Usitatibacter sp.]